LNFELTDQERESPLAKKLAAHLRERLGVHRVKNDVDLNQPDTAMLRGRIRECKVFLALFEGKPEFETPGTAPKA
jgi:hypothetical protein